MSSNNQPSFAPSSSSSTPPLPPPPSPPLLNEPAQREAQIELSKILVGIQHDPSLNGIWHLGKDGVMRSLTADRKVVDAVGLRPELVKAVLDRMPYNAENEINYRGADGTKVPREQWFHPPDMSLLPPPYIPPVERRLENLSAEKLEKNRQTLKEMKERNSCEPQIVSNHDLGLNSTSSNLEGV